MALRASEAWGGGARGGGSTVRKAHGTLSVRPNKGKLASEQQTRRGKIQRYLPLEPGSRALGLVLWVPTACQCCEKA